MSNPETSSSNHSKKSFTSLLIALAAIITVIASGLVTYILLELKFKDPISITISDWIKVILPVLGSGIVVVFAFLGVDRLKSFDERQDKLTKELREELISRINDATVILEPKFEKILKDKSASISDSISSYEGRIANIDEQVKRYEVIMGSINTLRTVAEAIGNIQEAQEYIHEQFSVDMDKNSLQWQERTRSLYTLVNRVKSEEIKGDSSDYHNMAVELARHSYYDLACEVINKGVHFSPYNVDLLSDALQYIHTFNNAQEMAEKSISTLEYIGRNGWNWRAFTFYINYLNGLDPSEENKKKIFGLINDYKTVLPDDERAYMAEYETYCRFGEIDKAENALIYAEENIDITAQCSLILSEIYRRKGEYDKAIFSATRAIQSQAEIQPSSNTGAAFANRAFAIDAKVFKQVLEENTTDEELIKQAISDFLMAQQLGFRYPNIQKRIDILERLLPAEEREATSLELLENRVDALEKLISAVFSGLHEESQ